eukprot:Phypoly_transcript_25191.p1 GENE.Phypoly_transcript_25191~~Phypoly_transcript_25191.p1  ORF type:complete len:123 (+),score=15.86 Phypoly_transcript_25191:23-370(+)
MASRIFRIVSVNKFPDRAQKIIARVSEELKQSYNLQHVTNVPEISQLSKTLMDQKPDVLFCASVWTPEETKEILNISQKVSPSTKTFVTPAGLHADKGESGVVDFIKAALPALLK